MFEKTQSDIVKGIRASKRDTQLYISSCIADIKTELSSTDPYVKANALQKLTFLQMMGYDMSWAHFSTIEVMSSIRFGHRRIGYLAACQSFNKDTEVILLSTNLFKKEMKNGSSSASCSIYDIGLALNCLSNIVTNDLARELLPDVTLLTTNHPSSYIRKKSVLCLFKLFIFYPQGLRLCFDKIQHCLEDSDPSVVSCAVNVITELSDKNPKNYLKLAPVFFHLLTSTVNNWMLIKVVKLLGSLVSEEPRLARKLLDPLVGIVKNTQAKSLLYEAVYTISLALPYCRKADGTMPHNVPDIVKICSETLASFVRDTDPNLKYLGLVGFSSLVESQNKVLIQNSEYRMLVLSSLTDDDDTIRSRALDLLEYMITKKNLQDLINQLIMHVSSAEGAYKREVISKIIYLCSMDKYTHVQDFSWYIRILLLLGCIRNVGLTNSIWITKQIMDVALRVFSVRSYMVKCMLKVLLEQKTTLHHDIYKAVAWVIGEYSHLLSEISTIDDDDDDDECINIDISSYHGPYHATISSLFASIKNMTKNPNIQAMYIQSTGKVLATACCSTTNIEIDSCLDIFQSNLLLLQQSVNFELQERSFTLYHLLLSCGIYSIKDGSGTNDDIDMMVNGEEKNEDDDLLQMGGTSTMTIDKPKINVISSASSSSSKYQQIGPFLTSLFIPEPMKPIPVKAQMRKKSTLHFSDSLNSNSTTYSFWNYSTKKTSFEEVSFISQRHTNTTIEEPPTVDSVTILSDGTSKSSNAAPPPPHSTLPSNYHNDPFYLPSSTQLTVNNLQTDATTNNATTTHPSKFGTIYLNFDTNEEEEVNTTPKTKKKKSKKKKSKKDESSNNVTDADMAIFSDPTITTSKPIKLQLLFSSSSNQQQQSNNDTVIVYKSDDEEVDEMISPSLINITNKKSSNKTHRKHKHSSADEFDMLRQVDLTKPLQDNEVMPITQHRQVVAKKEDDNLSMEISENKKDKKKKKKKDKKKKKSETESTTKKATLNHATSDLLGFGDDFTANVTSSTAAPYENADVTTITVNNNNTDMVNPINSAFDDLLGLTSSDHIAPLPNSNKNNDNSSSLLLLDDNNINEDEEPISLIPISPSTYPMEPNNVATSTIPIMPEQQQIKKKKSSSSKKKDKLWINAKFKSTQSMLSLSFYIHKNLKHVTLQLSNHQSIPLHNTTIKIFQQSASFNAVASNFSQESKKISVRLKDNNNSTLLSQQHNGTIFTSSSSMPFTFIIPTSIIHFHPVPNLTQDQVMKELSSQSNWYSQSCKLSLSSSNSNETIILEKFLSFFQAAPVEPFEGNNRILACQGLNCLVRVLLKIGKKKLKVDIKCTEEEILRCLVEDVKNICLE